MDVLFYCLIMFLVCVSKFVSREKLIDIVRFLKEISGRVENRFWSLSIEIDFCEYFVL